MSAYASYSDAIYYRVLSVTQTKRGWLTRLWGALDRIHGIGSLDEVRCQDLSNDFDMGYSIISGHNYSVSYSFYNTNDVTTLEESAEFLSEGESFLQLRPSKIRTGFRTDMRSVYISPPSAVVSKNANIINHVNHEGPSPEIDIPLKIKPHNLKNYGWLLVIFVGISLASGLLNPIISGSILGISESSIETLLNLSGLVITTFSFNLYTEYM